MTAEAFAGIMMPAVIICPVVVACVLLALSRWLDRPFVDAIAFLCAVAMTIGNGILFALSADQRLVVWLGGWAPHDGFGVGIALVGDQFGLGVVLIANVLMCCALAFSWRYFSDIHTHYHALMLMFLAGMTGFALAGDLFTMFVFFELMGVVAYALTAVKVEEPSALHGAINFGIINSLGAYVTLMGIGILYAATGQLNLAQLSQALAARGSDPLVVIGFIAVATGFLVKAAAVPFHFWLDDAHAVAPTPVCILFSGIMVELGVYGVARLYWIGFSGTITGGQVERALVILGVLTACLGGIMCLLQRHLKRLLAYSTIAHTGLFLIAIGSLDPVATAGIAIYVIGHAAVKSVLFLIAGIILNRYGSVDEFTLRSRGRDARVVGVVFMIAGLALAGLPPFATGLGKAISEDGLTTAGFGWGPVLFLLVSAVTGGAVLRAGARIFVGIGRIPHSVEQQGMSGDDEHRELATGLHRLPWTMGAPVFGLLAAGAIVGILPGFGEQVTQAAERFIDRPGYVAAVLAGSTHYTDVPPTFTGWNGIGLVWCFASVIVALVVAAATLYAPILPRAIRASVRPFGFIVRGLRSVHSGHVGDYVVWLLLGIGGIAALALVPT